MTPVVALTAAIPGTGTRSSGQRRHERAREGGGRQLGAPPQMKYARRRPMDWKGGSKRRTRDAEDGRWPRREDVSSLAHEMHEERRSEGSDRMRRARRSHARRAPFIHTEVEAGATQRRFDAQRKTGGGGRPALMASQQMERAAELQNPEVRAELNRHVRECGRKCFASGRLGSIPQASARAKQQATREQVKGQWCESRTGTAQDMRPGAAVLPEATRVC
jgi:hypothetical protein